MITCNAERNNGKCIVDITNMEIGYVCYFLGKGDENPASFFGCCSTNKRKFSIYPFEEYLYFRINKTLVD